MRYMDTVADYLDDLTHVRRLSASTRETYQSSLWAYGRYLARGEALGGGDAAKITYQEAATRDQVRRYLYHLSGRGLRPRTVRAALIAIRTYCAYLVREGALASDPTQGIRIDKMDAARRDIVTDEDAWALLSITERYRPARKAALHRAILATLIFTGIRAAELCDLRLRDLHPDSGELVVANGKGGVARTLYPPEEFWTALQAWLDEREKLVCKHDHVFAQASHKRVGYEGLRAIIMEARSLAGIANQEAVTAHALRHNFGVRMHRAGATVQQVSAALGHRTLQTTLIYLKIHEGDTRAMRQFAPLHRPAEAAPAAGGAAKAAPRAISVTPAPANTVPNPAKPSRATLMRQMRRRAASTKGGA